jgi:L-fucose/D-arabinose isomerase
MDAGSEEIPDDVAEKLLRFAKAGLAAATMKGRSYLSIGSVSMGIAGSIVNENFFQEYLGMRNEYVDMTEITRRLEEGIYDEEEFKKALEWTKKNCKEGEDVNPADQQFSRDRKDEIWEIVVKMTIIMRDLMVGNPTSERDRVWRGGARTQRHRRRVPGSAPVDRPLPEW